jgi:hypothetical protein
MNSETSAPTSGPSVSQETKSSAPLPEPRISQDEIDALNARNRAFVESIKEAIELAIEQGQQLRKIKNRMSNEQWTALIGKYPDTPSAFDFSDSKVRQYLLADERDDDMGTLLGSDPELWLADILES